MINILIKSILFPFLFLIPKNKNVILIGGWFGKRYSDNSRYLYNLFFENHNLFHNKKIYFITNSEEIYNELIKKDINILKKWSIKSIYLHLICNSCFVDQGIGDLNEIFLVNKNIINLWHGVPLKKIGALVNLKKTKIKRDIENLFNMNYFLGASGEVNEILKKSFLVKDSQIINGIYPRNYYLINSEQNFLTEKEVEIINYIKKLKKSYKIIFYLPTFRDNEKKSFLNTDSKEIKDSFFLNLQLKKYFFLTKLHFASILNKENIGFNHSNFLNLNSEIDVTSILPFVDILITDYSSVYFDFLYLDKKIVFYPYDFDYYKDKDRGFNFEYNEITPGEKVYDITGLYNAILREDNYSEFRKKIYNRVWNCNDKKELLENLKKYI